MRFNNIFVISVVLIALCAGSAQSIGDTIGKSVDQLIDESNGIHSHDIYHPENPQEARALWSLERGIDFTMPGKVLDNSTRTSPDESDFSAEINEEMQNQAAYNASLAQSTPYQEVATPQAATSQVAATQAGTSQAANASGNWSFRMRDSKKNRVLALTLSQSYNAVFGTGRINDGGDTMAVTASGSVEGDKLYLDATSSGTVTLYRLALTVTASGNSASGEYRAFSNGGETWEGLAEGVRIGA